MAFARLHPHFSPLPINVDIRLCSHNGVYKAIIRHASHAMSFTADLQTKDLKKIPLIINNTCFKINGISIFKLFSLDSFLSLAERWWSIRVSSGHPEGTLPRFES